MVKMLIFLRSISNSQVFLQKKNVSSFCKCKSYSHFSAKILTYAIFDNQSFNDTLTNDIISFKQMGLELTMLRITGP